MTGDQGALSRSDAGDRQACAQLPSIASNALLWALQGPYALCKVLCSSAAPTAIAAHPVHQPKWAAGDLARAEHKPFLLSADAPF